MPEPAALLEVEGLTKHYPIEKGMFRRLAGTVRAVDDVSFSIPRGRTLGLVGESGSGKTTVGRCVVRVIEPTAGAIRFTPPDGDAVDLGALPSRALRRIRREIQMIFQDPYSSLDPRMTVLDIVGEPLVENGLVH